MPENKKNGRNYTIILQRNITALNTTCCYLHEKKKQKQTTLQILFYKYSEDLATAAKVWHILNVVIPISSADKWS